MPEDMKAPNDPALDGSLITALFPGEVVTTALVRDVELPYGAGTMALITLDNGRDHTRPNTFGPAGLLALNDALDAVAARGTPEAGEQRIAAVGVTGKPFIFAVGADLSGAPLIAARDEALTIARLGHAVFRRLGALAYSLGIADAMFEPADFLAESLRWAARVLTGTAEVSRAIPAAGWDAASWDQPVAAARLFADGKLHGAAPAPYRAIDLVAAARGRTRDEGFAAEDEGLADLLLSEELRAGLYAFDLTQKRARHAAGAPDGSLARPVTKVGVVGAGLMAAQIALLFARRLEVPVVLTDLDQDRLDAGLGHVRAEVARLRARGRISADAAARLTALVTGSLTKDAFADADFVIEAVFEEMAVKQRVLAEVEAVVRPDCVLATNTSSLSVTEMASGLAHPERVAGFHFFNPVAMMPLVEVVRGAATDDPTAATALAVGTALKKNCVLVKDAPAFVVNRLLTRFLGEILACVDEGTPIEVAEHAPDPLGLPMSPFFLLQLVGPAVALHVGETLAAAYPDRFAPSSKLRALVAAGKPAVYRPDLTVDESVAALLAGGDRPSTAEEVRERALEALAEEIRRMLDEGVVAGPEDIDLCMILGAGWPFHLGGITPYLYRAGITEKVTGTRFRL